MSRTDTNRLIKHLAQLANDQPIEEIWITVSVGGQLITGQIISEDQFFDLKENTALKDIYLSEIKDPREKILQEVEKGGDVEFPDELREYFIYLKKATYLNTNISNTTDDEAGLCIQIRVSDISTFTYRGYNS